MTYDRPAPRRTGASRLRSIARTSAALILLLGGLTALLGWISTSGDGFWDVLGVILLVGAVLPTLVGLLGLLAARRPDDAPRDV